MTGHALDLEGKRFGRLVALGVTWDGGKRGWHCRCDCGKLHFVVTASLVQQTTTSCGCGSKLKNDMTGKRFGSLLVLHRIKKHDKFRRVLWHCRCDCGKEVDRWGRALESSHGSCGCKHVRRRKHPDEVRITRSMSQYASNARAKGYAFSLSRPVFKALLLAPCHYCGDVPANGIDRKDNAEGYVTNNVLPCCTACNYLKKATPYAEFVAHIHRMSAHLSGMESPAEPRT